MSEQESQVTESTESSADDGAVEHLSEQLGEAMRAMFKALMLLILAISIMLARALQALFTLVRFALPVLAAALQVVGALLLFTSVAVAYGGDLPALLLALAFVAIVPVVLVMLARGILDIWGILVASGALSVGAHLVMDRAPPTLLGALPGVGLSVCIFYLAFGVKSGAPDNEKGASDERE